VIRILLALAVLVATPRTSRADCAADADRLRAHMVDAQHRTHRWDLAWGLIFTGAAAIQVGLALTHTKPFSTFEANYEETLWVGAGKASIGAGSHLILPIRSHVPPPNADRCAELAALHKSVEKLGKAERQTFWLTHLGGLAVNLTGAAILWHRRSFAVGATSFLISLPVGPISAYTMPRDTWHLWREESPTWSVGVGVADGGLTLGVSGEL